MMFVVCFVQIRKSSLTLNLSEKRVRWRLLTRRPDCPSSTVAFPTKITVVFANSSTDQSFLRAMLRKTSLSRTTVLIECRLENYAVIDNLVVEFGMD